MAREQLLRPSASSLSASMRDLGYSLETAVADLIDNSISANATTVDILCDLTRHTPALAIIDNGDGMDAEALLAAMKHGSINPKEKRDLHDLGRFGLGLKTASFSQCRQMTVASTQNGKIVCAEWNLDLIDEKDDWIISILDEDEISELPFIDLLEAKGTIVIWQNLDRLLEKEHGQKRDEIVNEKLDIVEKHLALVFHRFLSGDVRGRKKISISLNGHDVEAFDPFCRSNPATQLLPEEIVRIDEELVQMRPYILPHHSRLSAKEYDYYQNRSDFISNQGAYIYRGGRLMAWGDWFRLIPKGEATKLARVQIDFPNSLDESWTIDIKKSRARPPQPVRDRLRQIIAKISSRSTLVHRGRGKKLFEEVDAPVWERYADQGTIRYTLNKEHPLVQSLIEKMDAGLPNKLILLLDSISSSLPIEMIYSDFSTNPRDIEQTAISEELVADKLRLLEKSLFENRPSDAKFFKEVVLSLKLFENHFDIVEKYIAEELK